MSHSKAFALVASLVVFTFTMSAVPIAAPAPLARAAALTAPAAADLLLPWDEGGEMFNHGGWHWCGNNKCPAVQACGDAFADDAGCDGWTNLLDPVCLVAMTAGCLYCGEFSDDCYSLVE